MTLSIKTGGTEIYHLHTDVERGLNQGSEDDLAARCFASLMSAGRELPQRRGNVAAVHGRDIGGGLERERLMQKRLRDILGSHFPAQQIAAHVIALTHAAGAGSLDDKIL